MRMSSGRLAARGGGDPEHAHVHGRNRLYPAGSFIFLALHASEAKDECERMCGCVRER